MGSGSRHTSPPRPVAAAKRMRHLFVFCKHCQPARVSTLVPDEVSTLLILSGDIFDRAQYESPVTSPS